MKNTKNKILKKYTSVYFENSTFTYTWLGASKAYNKPTVKWHKYIYERLEENYFAKN